MQIRVLQQLFPGDKKRSGENHRRKNPICVKKKNKKKTVQLLIGYHQLAGEKKTLKKKTPRTWSRLVAYFR
jgi:hypothetical protein